MKKENDLKLWITKNIKLIITAIITIIVIAVTIIFISNHYKKEENSIFRVKEIIFYNNANISNNSSTQSLENLSVCQYSDLSIYIDNTLPNNEITKANTIKKLYIDHISISSNSTMGRQVLNYKNPFLFGKYTYINQPDKNKITFNVIKTNYENNATNYEMPTFYTDCSNPLTLGYVNADIVQNYSISDASSIVSYNAKVLKEANVNLENINNTLHFTIHIVNNENHKFSCNMNVTLPLDEDFLNNGYSYISIPTPNDEYKFLRD